MSSKMPHSRTESTDSTAPLLPLHDYKSHPYRDSDSDLLSPLSPTFSKHRRRSRTSSPSSPLSSSFQLGSVFQTRRRWLFVTCAFLSAASLSALALLLILTNKEPRPIFVDESDPDLLSQINPAQCVQPSSIPVWDSRNALVGPPTRTFRDNLRNDTNYITSWFSAGWTNDVMTAANLIYLGIVTSRVPVIPPFTPSHIGGDVPPIPFSEVFNITRLSEAISRPVLDWHQVKELRDNDATGWVKPVLPLVDPVEAEDGTVAEPEKKEWQVEQDVVGCWSVWEAVQPNEHHPRGSPVPRWLGLDISYSLLPRSIASLSNLHTTFWALAQYAFPHGRGQALNRVLDASEREGGEQVTRPSAAGVSVEPEERMMCLDYLYYVAAQQPFEFEYDYSPAWREVGTHMHWSDRLKGITDGYLRKVLEVGEGEEIPPYIAIHARHGDFKVYCSTPPTSALDPSCFAPLSTLARRVAQLQRTLLLTKNMNVTQVLVTSDESDPAWWDEVRGLGWKWIDHGDGEGGMDTARVWGRWYPVLVDAVVQSAGVGFLGTQGSTMSLLGRRRVMDWQGGVGGMVQWGHLDADEEGGGESKL